jgi:hypothetical protein
MHIYVVEHIHNDAKMFIFDRHLKQHKKNFKNLDLPQQFCINIEYQYLYSLLLQSFFF